MLFSFYPEINLPTQSVHNKGLKIQQKSYSLLTCKNESVRLGGFFHEIIRAGYSVIYVRPTVSQAASVEGSIASEAVVSGIEGTWRLNR